MPALTHIGHRLVFLLVLLPTLFGPAHQAIAQDNTLWPNFRHDNQRTGQSPIPGPSFPDPLWQRDLRGFAYASPAFGPGGIIYAASERRLYAYTRSGAVQWTFDFLDVVPAAVDIRGIVSSPAVTPAGLVYIGSLDGYLYSLDAAGALRWRADTGGQVFSSPLVDASGRVYVGSRSGNVLAYNANGSLAWSFGTAGEVFASPALSPGGTLYVGATDGSLYALNSTTGALAWAPFNVGSEFVSSPVVGPDGVVYAGSLNDIVYAIDGATGARIWNYNTGGDIVSSPALGNNGILYVATLDGALHALDADTGAPRWSTPFQAAERVASSPAIGQDGLIYFGALDGTFYAIEDAGTQPVVAWTYAAGSPVWSSPAIGTGEALYFVSSGLNNDRGLLHAVGPSAFDVRFQGVPTAGEDATLTINQPNSATPASGTLFYRRAGEQAFQQQNFAGESTIPGNFLTESGLEYYIEDVEGAQYPSTNPQGRPATQVVRVQTAAPPFELTPRAYRMISVPLLLDDTSLEAQLADDYGDYDPQAWRLLRWKGDAFVEFPTLDDPVRPGEAFFLITRDGASFDAGGGFSVTTSLPYPVLLQPGWNMIGHPFNFPVSWGDVDRDASVVNAIAYFDGVEMVQDPAQIATLDPWEGYFVFNASDEPVTIAIPPTPAPPGGSPEGENILTRITATIPGQPGIDSQNWIGLGEREQVVAEAPAVADGLALSVMVDDLPAAVSVHQQNAGQPSWSLRLRGPADAVSAELRFEDLDALAGDAPVFLVDEDFGFAQRIEDGRVRVALSPERTERRLRLSLGTPDDVAIAPARTALLPNYPNPFSGSTTLAYTLAEPAEVNLTVYNTLGQAVGTLVRGWQTPGQYEVDWSASHSPSGVYFYRLQAGAFVASGSLIVLP